MLLNDLLKMSYASLRRTKLRTFLTGSGVVIGIGALTSMVSFGAGLQKNISDAMKKTDVFTSIEVTSRQLDFARSGQSWANDEDKPSKVITDSTMLWLSSLPGVKMVYPEVIIPSQLRFGERITSITAGAVPLGANQFFPFNQIDHGAFFSSDTAREVIISKRILKRLHVDHPDSLLGKEVKLVTARLSFENIGAMFGMPIPSSKSSNPFAQEINEVKVIGIWSPPEFSASGMADVTLPMGTSKRIARLDFRSVWDLLQSFSGKEGYPMVHVRVGSFRDVEPVIKSISDAGYGVVNVLQQIDELRRGFLIFDAALGAVGTIALFVASLGIINTMVMSVLERYREIGIMKAIGATHADVKLLFVVESSVIGFVGGVLGVILGWIVTLIAQVIANQYILRHGGEIVKLFYIPVWLIAASIAFAILVSLAAGIYPAARAAKVDPVQALRHE